MHMHAWLCASVQLCVAAVSKWLPQSICITPPHPADFSARTCRYFGPLGFESSALIAYLEAVPGVQPIRAGSNPATWCVLLGLDVIYTRSGLWAAAGLLCWYMCPLHCCLYCTVNKSCAFALAFPGCWR